MILTLIFLYSSQIGVAPERVYDDAFTLQEVIERDSNNFNYVCGMVPMVLNMVTDVSIIHMTVNLS